MVLETPRFHCVGLVVAPNKIRFEHSQEEHILLSELGGYSIPFSGKDKYLESRFCV